MTTFHQLNRGWNAEPNAPEPKVEWRGADLILSFLMNPYQFPKYGKEDVGQITFADCSRYRLGTLNDEGWYRGQGRFHDVPHRWGEFYEVRGDLRWDAISDGWRIRIEPVGDRVHFLFYFRDEDFECDARSWSLDVIKG